MYGGGIESRRREQWAEMLGRNADVANWQRDPRITGGQGMEMERGMNETRDGHYGQSTGRRERENKIVQGEAGKAR